jgi:phosphoribosylglycinamide formyltransferase-1
MTSASSAITPCRIVVLISGSGSNLQALIDGQKDNSLAINIAAVISNKTDVLGLERAEKAGIPAITLNHKEFADREAFDKALMNQIDEYQPDLVVLAGFMRILTPEFVLHYQHRMLNIHPSLLPKYQGLNTHQRALDAKDPIHGVTVHFVTEELDGGPPVIQAIVPVHKEDTADILAKRVQAQEHIIYPMAVDWFASQRLQLSDDKVLLDGEPLPQHGYQIDTTQ